MLDKPYAAILNWLIIECREPGHAPTRHVGGWVLVHHRLTENFGDPYISSPLKLVDLGNRQAINERGKIIALVNDAYPDGLLPKGIQDMCRRAEVEWQLAEGTVWVRVEEEV